MTDSEDGADDDIEFETRTSDVEAEEDAEIDEDLIDALEADATDGDDDSPSEDSDDGSDDDDEEEEEPPPVDSVNEDGAPLPEPAASRRPSPQTRPKPSKAPSPAPPSRTRSLSPATTRRKTLRSTLDINFRSYAVEAICAIPHPVPTHALASSACMTHLLTGSDDGYIRDYDVFTAVNGKNFLTAPQRHHCGVVEGLMKAGQIRSWWENPDLLKYTGAVTGMEEPSISSVYSLSMHSDALWALAGSDAGHINLFTVRHEPGRLCHVMNAHRGPVSAIALTHDEKGFFSAGWDGEALEWDLNTGNIVRNFTAHGAQLAGIAVRPLYSGYHSTGTSGYGSTKNVHSSARNTTGVQHSGNDAVSDTKQTTNAAQDSDSKSDASFDPLFDDEPDADGELDNDNGRSRSNDNQLAMPENSHPPSRTQTSTLGTAGSVAPPKNAPPILDPATYSTFSSDVLMTTSIDGQIILWDRRVNTPGHGVGRLWMSEKTPPWCLSACWSADGGQIYAGRRNGTIDIWDTRQIGRSGPSNTPRLLKTLRNPVSSGVVSCVVAFPDGRHIACASNDNIRLWNAAEAGEPDGKMRGGVQFKIIPGHHGGYVSQMIVDSGGRFLVSASSNRGWHGDSTRTVFVHDVKPVQ